jgi:peptide/nickel transport system permease protein
VALLGDAYTEEGAVRGDWGTSILSGHPVLTDVLNRLPVTMELIVLSMAVALVIAIPAAIIGAIRQNTGPTTRRLASKLSEMKLNSKALVKTSVFKSAMRSHDCSAS